MVVVVVMVVVGHNTMVRYRLSIDLSPRFWTTLICRAVDVDVSLPLALMMLVMISRVWMQVLRA